MKNKISTLLILLIGIFWFASCEDPTLVKLNDNVADNVLDEASATDYILVSDDATDEFETFEWTAPDFGFTASVTYKLEMVKSGDDFADAVELASVNNKLNVSLTVAEVNEKLLGIGINPEESGEVKLRVSSFVNDHVDVVYSNEIAFTVTPYATSFPPIYGMGAALKGWGPWPDNAVEWQSSEYKKYETVAYFTSGEIFRFFAQLNWDPVSYNYPYFTSVDPIFELNPDAGDNDKNFKVVASTGWYKVNVDLTAKTVTALPVSEPVLYMTGAALNGWNWNPGTPVKMTYIKPGIFTAQATFSVETFRFFAQADWGPTSYNYPYFTSVDAKFENANDGDKNLKFIGTPGSYKITVDLNEKTVVVGDTPKPKLYMTGAALNGWNWNPGTPVDMTYISPGVYEATATFTSAETFRFFAQADWGPTSYNYPYFTSVDPEFANAADGDSNLRYTGATGSRKITVNLTAKTVDLE